MEPRGHLASGFWFHPSKKLMCWRQPLSNVLWWAWSFWAAPHSSFFAISTGLSYISCCAAHAAARRWGQRCQQPTGDHGPRGKCRHWSLADLCAEGGYLRKHICAPGLEPKAKTAKTKTYFWLALSLRTEIDPGQSILVMSYFSAFCALIGDLLTSCWCVTWTRYTKCLALPNTFRQQYKLWPTQCKLIMLFFCNVNMNFILLFILHCYMNCWKKFYLYFIAFPFFSLILNCFSASLKLRLFCEKLLCETVVAYIWNLFPVWDQSQICWG